MEAIRQLYDRNGGAVAQRIGTVVFASPDIDKDVFSSSVAHIGPLASKITVITATNDRALAVSRWMAGGITRVGAAEHAELERLGLRVIDASTTTCSCRMRRSGRSSAAPSMDVPPTELEIAVAGTRTPHRTGGDDAEADRVRPSTSRT
jgi:esterase/lipase superfamily enzyme